LSLSNSILALNDRQDSFHLDGGRVFVTVAINSTQNFFLKSHIVKFANFQIPVRLEEFFVFFFFLFFCFNTAYEGSFLEPEIHPAALLFLLRCLICGWVVL